MMLPQPCSKSCSPFFVEVWAAWLRVAGTMGGRRRGDNLGETRCSVNMSKEEMDAALNGGFESGSESGSSDDEGSAGGVFGACARRCGCLGRLLGRGGRDAAPLERLDDDDDGEIHDQLEL